MIAAVRVMGGPVPVSSRGPARVQIAVLRTFKGSPVGTDLTLVLAPSNAISPTVSRRAVEHVMLPRPDRRDGRVSARRRDLASVRRISGESARRSSAPRSGLVGAVRRPRVDRRSGPRAVDRRRRDPFRYRVGEPVLSGRVTGTSRGETSCCGIATGRSNRTRAGTFAWSGQGRGPWSRLPIPTWTRHRSGSSSPGTLTGSTNGYGRARRSSSTWTGSTSPSPAGATGSASTSATIRWRVPGEYTISAVGRFFHPGTPVATRPLRVWID